MTTWEPQAGDVAVLPLPDGAFGAVQVTHADGGSVTVCALRWRSVTPPTLSDLDGAGPLMLDHHAWGDDAPEPEHLIIDRAEPVPPGLRPLGARPVPPGVAEPPRSYGGWRGPGLAVLHQLRWEQDVPAPVRAAYRRARDGGPVQVDLGDGPVTVPAARTGVLELSGPRWTALDLLPRVTGIAWSGPDRGLTAQLAARPLLDELIWADPPSGLDLSGVRTLHELTLTGTAPALVRLPPRLETLVLRGDDFGGTVFEATDDGRWISVHAGAGPLPSGLRAVRALTLDAPGEVALPAAFPSLISLRVRFTRAPGLLTGDGHATLEQLTIIDGYAVDAATLPALPALRHLTLDGLRRSAVAPLRARFRGTPVRLLTRGAKADAWLAANLDNPLRDWADDHERAGAAACAAYATAHRAIARGTGSAETVLKAFVDRLNAIDARYRMIDTLRREEACEAFGGLAALAGIAPGRAETLCDEWREF